MCFRDFFSRPHHNSGLQCDRFVRFRVWFLLAASWVVRTIRRNRRKAVFAQVQTQACTCIPSGTPQRGHTGGSQPVGVTLHSGTPPPGPGDRHRGILGGDSGAGRIRIRKRRASGLTTRGSTADSTPDAEVRQDVTRRTRKRWRATVAALHLKRKQDE